MKMKSELNERKEQEIQAAGDLIQKEVIRKWKKTETDEISSNSVVISKSEIKKALRMLKQKLRLKKYKATTTTERSQLYIRRRCKSGYNSMETAPWNSPVYITKCLRTCILKRDFTAITQLLLVLVKEKSYYLPYVKQVLLFNLMLNSHHSDGRLLSEFNQMFSVTNNVSEK